MIDKPINTELEVVLKMTLLIIREYKMVSMTNKSASYLFLTRTYSIEASIEIFDNMKRRFERNIHVNVIRIQSLLEYFQT
jgi:hypothetical protein